MFTLLLLKLKSMFFGNLSAIFMTGLVAIFAVVVLFNVDTLLSGLGFQTRSSLAADASKGKEQLKTAARINEELVISMQENTRKNKNQILVIETKCKDTRVIDAQVAEKKTSLDQKANVIKTAKAPASKSGATGHEVASMYQLQTPSTVTVKDLTSGLTPKQLNELSVSNITAINESFNELFPQG